MTCADNGKGKMTRFSLYIMKQISGPLILLTFSFSGVIWLTQSRTPTDTPGHSLGILEALWNLPDSFREKSKFHENIDLLVSLKNLCSTRKSSQGIESTQRMHFWICLDLTKVYKLVRSQLNTRILSYDHFSDDKLRIVMGPF